MHCFGIIGTYYVANKLNQFRIQEAILTETSVWYHRCVCGRTMIITVLTLRAQTILWNIHVHGKQEHSHMIHI